MLRSGRVAIVLLACEEYCSSPSLATALPVVTVAAGSLRRYRPTSISLKSYLRMILRGVILRTSVESCVTPLGPVPSVGVSQHSPLAKKLFEPASCRGTLELVRSIADSWHRELTADEALQNAFARAFPVVAI